MSNNVSTRIQALKVKLIKGKEEEKEEEEKEKKVLGCSVV